MKRFAVLFVSTATAALLISAAPASATTNSYACAGSAASWTVPVGVTSFSYTIKGAGGGAGGAGESTGGGSGGTGASYTGSWNVSTGQTVSFKVGCKGAAGLSKRDGDGAVSGGWGYFSGGGGGAAGTRDCGWLWCSYKTSGSAGGGGGASGISIGSLFVVAGGGGGGGGGSKGTAGGGAYAATNNGTALAAGTNGRQNAGGSGGSGGSGGGGGNPGGSVTSTEKGGNGGQNGRSAASSDASIKATLSETGGSGQGTDGSISFSYFKPVSVSGAPTGTVNASTASVSFSYPDTGHTFECKTDAGAWTACTSPLALSGLADGSHSLGVRPVDSAGVRGAETTKAWTVDATPPPAPTFVGAPTGTISVNLVAFFVSDSESGVTLSCALDGGEFAPCGTSLKILSGLAEGKHRYVVKAADAAGNSSTSEAAWSVDSSAAAAVSGNTGPAPAASTSPDPSGLALGNSMFGSCAIAKVVNAGDLVCWKNGLGPSTYDATLGRYKYPMQVDKTLDGGVIQVDSGRIQQCVLFSSGGVKCRSNSNSYGVLGDGSSYPSPYSYGWVSPFGITEGQFGDTQARQVAVPPASYNGCAVLAKGQVICWGENTSSVVSGNASDWGNNKLRPVLITTLPVPVKKVAMQDGAACALGTDGQAYCWGQDSTTATGALGRWEKLIYRANPAAVNYIISGAPKYPCTYAGEKPYNVPTACTGVTSASELPTTGVLTGLTDIASSSSNSCAVKSDGSVYCWGSGEYGALGDGRNYCSRIYMPADSTCNFNTTTLGSMQGAVKVVGITNAVKIFALKGGSGSESKARFCAILATGDIKCWGSMYSPLSAQPSYFGDGTTSSFSNTPVTITTSALGGKAVDMSVSDSVCAILDTGKLRCWGSTDALSTLGLRSAVSPVDVPFGPFVITAPPAAPIMGVPVSPTKSTSASISFKGEAGATFQCSVDGGAYSACSSPKSLSSLSDGTHSVSVKQTGAGGESPVSTVSWTVSSKLDAPVVADVPTGTTLNTSASISFTGAAGATFQCSIDGGPYAPCESPVAMSSLTLDKHSFSVLAVKDGLVSAPAGGKWVVADSVTPAAPDLSGAPTGTSTSRSASISISSTDSGVDFECSVDGGSYAACSSPWTSSTLTDGSHTLSVKAISFGFRSLATDVTWKVDATPPAAPTLVNKPTAFSRTRTPSVAFTAESGATFVCSFDSAAYAPCTSPWAASSLDDGSHTFRVKAVDAAGNTGDFASAEWVLDTVAPAAPSLDSNTAAVTNATSASFLISGEAGGSFLCQLDSETPVACTSPVSYSGLAEGAHKILVRTVDKAGNTSLTSALSWTIDLTGPTAPTFITKPDAVVGSTYANFNFASAAGEPVTYKCSLDSAAYADCTPPTKVSGVAPGDHSYRVVAVDALGNLGNPVTATWTVGNPPEAPRVSQPEVITSETSTWVAFGSTETGVTYQCSVDGGAYSACTSPKLLTGLSDGQHGVSVKAVNSVGASAATQVFWIVDTVAPVAPSLTGLVSGLTRTTSQSVTWTGESGPIATCSVDGSPYASCSRPKTLSSLADGEHTVAVKLRDGAGNTSSAGTLSWTVDTTAPSTPVLSGAPTGTTASKTASINISSDEGTTVECSLDNGAWASCSSPKSVSGLAIGAHVFKARSTDAAGNVSASGSAEWTVVPPGPPAKPTLSGTPSSLTNSSSASVGFTSDSDATFTCSVDGGAFTACTSPKSLSGLADGVHSLVVKATGAGGSSTESAFWTVDTAAPAVPTLTGAPGGVTNQGDARIAISAEPGASLACSLDGGEYSACSSPVSLTGLTEAEHSLSVKATDAAGNTSSAASASWTVDMTAPSVELTSNPHGTLSSTSASIAFTATQADTVTCSLDGGAYTACTSPVSLTGLAEGQHSLTVKGVDAAGNVASTTTEKWTVDTVGPTVTFAGAPSGVRSGPAETFGANVEAGATLECKLDSGAWATCSSAISLTSLTEGNHTLKVRGTDAVGNVGPEATAAWYSSVPAAPGSGVTLNMGTLMTANLTTPPGVGSTPVVTYQWQRCATADPSTCVNITGAIVKTYTPFSADVGQRVGFSATFTGGGKTVTVWSPISAVVMPSITTAPALTYETGFTAPVKGRFVGTTSGRVEGWTLLPTRLYQWQRCPAAGGACTDIAGATTTVYRATASDVGFKLKLQYVFKADSVAPLNGFSLNGVTDLTPVVTAS